MPPRSVCLNVFTTSLGSGSVNKEAEVVVKEVKGANGDGAAEERARHDSVQEGTYRLILDISIAQLNVSGLRTCLTSFVRFHRYKQGIRASFQHYEYISHCSHYHRCRHPPYRNERHRYVCAFLFATPSPVPVS
jgi:hypothetical protein